VPGVAKQWEIQGELVTERLVAGAVVAAHAEDEGFPFELRRGIAELLALNRASWRVVLRVKEEHDLLSANL
jgi:hypothetical protein